MLKKLLIVSRSTIFHNKSGGMETQLANLIKALKITYEITVLSTSLTDGQNINKTEIHDGVTYIFLKGTTPGEYGINLYENIFWQLPIKRSYNNFGKNFRKISAEYFEKNLKNNFNIILSQSSAANNFKINKYQKIILIYHGTTLNELKSRYSGVRSVKDYIRVVFLDFPTLLYEYLVKNTLLFRKTHKIVLVSNLFKKDFENQYPFFKNKVVVIENAIDTEKFVLKDKNKNFTVVYFGRIDFEKGIKDIIEVSENVAGVTFKIYGSGTDRREFEALVKNKKTKNLFYYGEVTNTEIASILSKSHCFLFLSKRKEGFPMSVLEAMSSGCLVITTVNLKSINKLFPYYKVSSISEAIKLINTLEKEDKKVIKKQMKLSRDFIKKYYSLEILRKKYEELLK